MTRGRCVSGDEHRARPVIDSRRHSRHWNRGPVVIGVHLDPQRRRAIRAQRDRETESRASLGNREPVSRWVQSTLGGTGRRSGLRSRPWFSPTLRVTGHHGRSACWSHMSRRARSVDYRRGGPRSISPICGGDEPTLIVHDEKTKRPFVLIAVAEHDDAVVLQAAEATQMRGESCGGATAAWPVGLASPGRRQRVCRASRCSLCTSPRCFGSPRCPSGSDRARPRTLGSSCAVP